MKILLVIAHPRSTSLTHAVAEQFAAAARVAGHSVEMADLVKEGFDPVLREEDEPDWSDPDKVYSDAVRREMARIERHDATVMVFPVWWWSMPAILKGWIDRVWNNGWAYGGRTYPHNRVLMIAVAGGPREGFEKRGYDTAIFTQLATGILGFCGISDGRLEVFYGAVDEPDAPKKILDEAKRLGSDF